MPIADSPPVPPPAQVRRVETFDIGGLPGSPVDPASAIATGKVDLGIVRPRCPVAQTDEIVVCARNPEEDRLRAASGPPLDPILPKAETKLGNVTLDVHTEAAMMANGQISNRVMVGVKLPF